MESLLNRLRGFAVRLFPILWRLAILALPWQTRWFHESQAIAGYPWEEGRVSVYASWIVIGLTIICSLATERNEKPEWLRFLKKIAPWSALIFLSLLTTRMLSASLEWWFEILLLFVFFFVLAKRVMFEEFLPWFAFSLVPHAVLGLVQVIQQSIIGSSWLGIATQSPLTQGVAVIEIGALRWLRVYGGFPHPNIFGGWLALAILFIVLQLQQPEAIQCWKSRLYYSCLPLFSFTLAFTYSRSAVLGLIGGLGILACSALWSSRGQNWVKPSLMKPLLLIVVSFAIVFFTHPELVSVRTDVSTRLEQKSLSERSIGIQNGLRILKVSPFFGSGPGANAWMLAELDRSEGRPATVPISPHLVPLLALAEFGLLGSIGWLCFLAVTLRRYRRSWSTISSSTRFFYGSLIAFSIPLLCLDHYLWSYWSGKALFAIFMYGAVFVFSRERC